MKKTAYLALTSFLIISASAIRAQDTRIKVTGIRSQKGNVIINVFRDQESYNQEEAFKSFTFSKKEISEGIITVKISPIPGIFGLTMIDDENSNGKIDKNLIGMPKEGFGFSNFFMEKMKRPIFNDFKVDPKKQADITIKVKYI